MHRGSIRALAELEARRSILCSAADWSWWHRYFDSRFCCVHRVLRLAKTAGAIITIDQAIEAGSFLDGAHFRNSIDKGDLEAGFKASDLVWEGTTYVIGQHAFPMEKQAALAVPEEKKGMTAPWCLLLTSIDHLPCHFLKPDTLGIILLKLRSFHNQQEPDILYPPSSFLSLIFLISFIWLHWFLSSKRWPLPTKAVPNDLSKQLRFGTPRKGMTSAVPSVLVTKTR